LILAAIALALIVLANALPAAVVPLVVVVVAHLLAVAVVVTTLLARMIAETVTTIVETEVTALAALMIGQHTATRSYKHFLIEAGIVTPSVMMTARMRVRTARMETIGKVIEHLNPWVP